MLFLAKLIWNDDVTHVWEDYLEDVYLKQIANFILTES